MKDKKKTDEGRGKMDENRTSKIRTVRDLKVYRKAFDSAMNIFKLSNGLMTVTSIYLRC